MANKIIGPLTIHFPDENDNSFWIFEDCAELFGYEYQRDAFTQLKAKLRDTKPKPSMDYEADAISIRSTNIETILTVILTIIELSTPAYKPEFKTIEIEELRGELIFAKKNRPKPKRWNTGDVFIVPLSNGSSSIGQVLDKDYCTCALFDLISDNIEAISKTEFDQLRPLSILHLSNGDLLNNGVWRILFNGEVKLDPASGHGGRKSTIGCISYGQCGSLTELAEAYYGIIPWNVMYQEDYYDKMLLKGVRRPITANVLSAYERRGYRLQNFKTE